MNVPRTTLLARARGAPKGRSTPRARVNGSARSADGGAYTAIAALARGARAHPWSLLAFAGTAVAGAEIGLPADVWVVLALAVAITAEIRWAMSRRHIRNMQRAFKDVGLVGAVVDGKNSQISPRRSVLTDGVLTLRFALPPGLTHAHILEHQAALEASLGQPVATWIDRNLLCVQPLQPVPDLVEYAEFYADPLPAGRLVLGIGTGVSGRVTADLPTLPHLLVGGKTGGGKALALDTPIATPSGWTTMGALEVGDAVFDENGSPCLVTATTEVMTDHKCYDVTFSDGSVIVADADHQWFVWSHGARCSATIQKKRIRAVDNPYAQDQRAKCTLPGVVTTAELSAASGRRHSIPVAGALALPDIALPIDPYLLGIWLGDGTTVAPIVTKCVSDMEEIAPFIRAAGFTVTQQPSSPGAWQISSPDGPQHSFKADLRNAGVLGNKHIPAVYQRAGVDQRRALLAGLLDTDGYCAMDGGVELAFTLERLARDAFELVIGLGHRATLRQKVAPGGRVCRQVCYTIAFATSQRVFRLSRKGNRQSTASRAWADHRYITAVTERESVPVRCIEVDSPNHLYLAGRTLIPTHNSVFLSQMITSLVERYTPEQLRIGLIDLKGGIELHRFSQMPHTWHPTAADGSLLEGKLADDLVSAAAILGCARREVDRRIQLLREAEVVDIDGYNDAHPSMTMPRLLIVIDEVAELVCKSTAGNGEAKAQVEAGGKLNEIARLGRAVGVHLVCCTQRPDKDAVPGQLKSNLGATMAFSVRNQVNAGVLDAPGAEHLAAVKGRALWCHDGSVEVQAPYLPLDECKRRLAAVSAAYGTLR